MCIAGLGDLSSFMRMKMTGLNRGVARGGPGVPVTPPW